MSPDQIIATFIALMSQATEPAFDPLNTGGHDDRYPVSIEACPRPLGPLEVEGRTVICGRIAMPEDHDTAGGKTLPLAFALLKSRSAAPAPDPVIYLHGGPESMFERSHSPILEQLVDNDVLVIAPNIRGSEGYGRRFIGLDDGNRRTDALADVIALREHVQARHGLDDDKIGIMGHSYGGFMTLMAISHHPGLWACAVDIAGMSHLGNFLKTAPAWRRSRPPSASAASSMPRMPSSKAGYEGAWSSTWRNDRFR